MEIAILAAIQTAMIIILNFRCDKLKELIDVIGKYLAINIILEEKDNDKKKSD